MSHKYYCKYCEHCSSTNSVVNHFLENHCDKLDNHKLLQGIKGNLVEIYIRSEKNEDPEPIKCCFGCKKFWARVTMADKHKKDCNMKQQHINKCKELKEKIIGNDNEICADEQLKKKISNLESKIIQLEEQIKENEEGKEKYDVLSLILIEYLDRFTREKIADVLENLNLESIDWYSELLTYRESTKEFA